MKILGMDTTGGKCSVAIMDGDTIVADLSLNDKNTHSINLMPMIEKALETSKLAISDIDAFAVNIGPGSFTGIRIGVCAVMGLALSDKKPCIAVETMESLAYNALPYAGVICPLVDARRTESYTALFQSDGQVITQIGDNDAKKVSDILAELPEGEVCFVGDGAVNYREIIVSALGKRAVFLPEEAMLPSAVSVLKAARVHAKNNEMTSVYELSPYYLRSSQAERMKGSR